MASAHPRARITPSYTTLLPEKAHPINTSMEWTVAKSSSTRRLVKCLLQVKCCSVSEETGVRALAFRHLNLSSSPDGPLAAAQQSCLFFHFTITPLAGALNSATSTLLCGAQARATKKTWTIRSKSRVLMDLGRGESHCN